MAHSINKSLTKLFSILLTPPSGAGGLLFLCLISFSLKAQDTIINRNVSVEREYRPVIQDAGKINSLPEILEPRLEKTQVKYSDFNLPLNISNNIHTLSAAEIITGKPNNKEGFARIGLGSYSNTLADFAYPIINTSDARLDFSLSHLGTFEDRRMHSTSVTALTFEKIFKTINLYAGLSGGHEALNYYGNNYFNSNTVDLQAWNLSSSIPVYFSEANRAGINPTTRTFTLDTLAGFSGSQTFWRFNAFAGVSSIPLKSDVRFKLQLNYNIFSAINGLNENILHTEAKLNLPRDNNRMGLDIDVLNMMYSSATIPAFNFWKNYSVLTLNPYYAIEGANWNVRLGLKSSFMLNNRIYMYPSVDVQAEWKAIPKYFSLYGAITGDYDVNTLDKISTENPYVFSDLRVNDTYTPYKLVAGIKLKPVYNLILDAYVGYRQINNQYFYVNKEYDYDSPYFTLIYVYSPLLTNRFNVVYSNTTLFNMGIRANYNWQNFLNVELKAKYNEWSALSELYAWNKPKYEAELNANVKINPNLSASANLFYEGGRYAKFGRKAILMNDKVDINLGISYSYSTWLSIFGKVNNLINSQYQNYYGYDVQGINMMVGVAFSF